EPSTLILLGAGLAAGGAYAFLRYRKRDMKK
ncbi:MAG: PEP-CTERM sorting domain-containing protein, partial [Candidatus Hodarchaeota archaeon]